MKAWAWLAAVSILGSIAHAESLGEVAKRERERREKNKRQGTETKVINDDDLTAGRDKDSKGTFNPGAGLATGRGGAGTSGPSKGSTPPSPSASPAGGDAVTEVDVRRAGARQRLESSYEKIAGEAWSLAEAVKAVRVVRRDQPLPSAGRQDRAPGDLDRGRHGRG